MNRFAISLVLASCLTFEACTPSSQLALIDALANIAVSAAEVNGAIPPQYKVYVDSALACADTALSEAQSTDTNAVKTSKITAACVQAGGSFIPPGLPTALANTSVAIANAVAKLLATMPAPPVAVSFGARSEQSPVVNLTDAQKIKIESKKNAVEAARASLKAR